MRLKSIDIQGFKSFADRTKLEFDKNISVIVGPNGSGKSNISDAIRWVLGEQSAKSLRGSKMEDVIFTGTEKKRALNYSSVSITFDNNDQTLPIDYNEVQINRKVYRDGESNYSINRSSCRLKEIKELFYDTGVGKEGYSIISQGRIDEILNSKAEERRLILDEAAGTSKFKHKKEEANRNLEKTMENLARIGDMIDQQEEKSAFLSVQAQKAEKGLKLAKQLEHLQHAYLKKEWSKLQASILQFQQKIDVLKNEKFEEEKTLDETQKALQEQKATEHLLDEEMQNTENHLRESLDKETANSHREKLLDEKHHFFEQRKKQIKLEIHQFQVQLEEMLEAQKALEDKVTDCAKQKEIASIEIAAAKEVLAKEGRRYQDGLSLLERKQQKLNDLQGVFQERSLKQVSQKLRKESRDKEKLDIELQLKMNTSNQQHMEASIQKDEEKEIELRDDCRKVQEEIEHLDQELKRQEDMKNRGNQRLSEISIEKKAALSSKVLLENLKNSYDGYYRPVQLLMQDAKKNAHIRDLFLGTLAELIEVRDPYKKAIEVALASNLQNVVTKTDQDAKTIISYIKEKKWGRITFLPLNTIKSRSVSIQHLGKEDYLSVATDAISCPKEIKHIIEYFLNRTLIVENMDRALEARKKDNINRYITLDGDILNNWGSMVGGSSAKSSASLVNRTIEIQQFSNKINELNREESVLQNQVLESSNEFESLQRKIYTSKEHFLLLQDQLKEILSEKTKKSYELSHLMEAQKELRTKQEMTLEIVNLSLDDTDIEALEIELKELKEEVAHHQIEISARNEKVQQLEKDLIQEINREELLNRDLQLYENQCSKNEDEREEKVKLMEHRNAELEQISLDMTEILNEKEEISKVRSVSEKQIELLKLEQKNQKSQRMIYRESYEKLQDEVVEQNVRLNRMVSEIESAENKKQNLSEKIEEQLQQLMEEYGYCDEAELLTALENTSEIETGKKMITDVKNALKQIGYFSFDAIEEYRGVKSHLEFLKEQEQDLLLSKEDIHSIILSLDQEIIALFSEGFERVNEKFGHIFSILFQGGSASLKLDSTDVLTAGIEIEVQPPGKKTQSLSLLSGGERALTAVALLFAIFETRPAPFCILDEIDAALDEANIGKYISYLQSFKDIQFIVITHRKATMEMADSLFGVSMPEEGISKVIKLSLENTI